MNKDFWGGKRILITGGCGFIGHNLALYLADNTDVQEIIIVDKNGGYGYTKLINHPWYGRGKLSIIITDNNSECVDKHLYDYTEYWRTLIISPPKKIDVFIHLAAVVGNYQFYKENGGMVLLENTFTDTYWIKYAIEKKIPYFFYASSSHVYGDKEYSYESSTKGENLLTYGQQKLVGEEILLANRSHFKGLILARLNGIYGEGQKYKEDSCSVLPQICHRILYNKPFLNTTGQETRSFLYITDAIEAILLLVENSENCFVVQNVGSGDAYEIGVLSEKLIKISGKTLKLEKTEKKAELMNQNCNVERLKTLGWFPKVSIDDGLKKLYEYVQERENDEHRKNV